MTAGSVRERARAWIAGDPDPDTRAELSALLAADDGAALAERMAGPLEFGTAGLRGIVGAGSARMNRAVVIRTTRAVADTLLARVPDARALPVVVGFDARASSRRFAEDTIGVLLAAGIPVRHFSEPVATPLVAYAARVLGASAAVVITASHNPPEYNGYKLYGPDAVQISAPLDQDVSRRLAQVGAAADIPCEPGALSGTHPLLEPVAEDLVERYWMELSAGRPEIPRATDLRIVYTPLHGVGRALAEPLLRRAGYDRLEVVSEQAEPDPRFPTVRFPNPEEPGALDLAIAQVVRTGADLLVANDPDADRLALGVPVPSGGVRRLSGNEVGLLLADYVLEHAPKLPEPLVVQSIVSSPMLASIARAHGAAVERTLTGFKWIWRAALERQHQGGVRFAYGYEEALGYSVGTAVRDKDGISAAVHVVDLAAHCRARGTTLLEALARLHTRHGYWFGLQQSRVLPGLDGLEQMRAAMQRLRTASLERLGDRKLVRKTDYLSGAEARPAWLGAADLVELELDGPARVLVRPSGTEPKLKAYVDVCVGEPGPPPGEDWHSVGQRAAERLAIDLWARLGLRP